MALSTILANASAVHLKSNTAKASVSCSCKDNPFSEALTVYCSTTLSSSGCSAACWGASEMIPFSSLESFTRESIRNRSFSDCYGIPSLRYWNSNLRLWIESGDIVRWAVWLLPTELMLRKICLVPESNQRHEDFQSSALPTELTRHKIAGVGFEPTTFGLWARRASRLLHPAISYFCTWFLK